MEDSSVWGYLDNVWILTGLVMVILVSLLKMLSINNQNNRKTKQQLQKGVNYLFVLGLTGMALGTLFSQNSNLTSFQQSNTDLFGSFPNQDYIDANSSQAQSADPAINAGGSADFNQFFHEMPDRTRSARPNAINQPSVEDNGIVVNASEDDFY